MIIMVDNISMCIHQHSTTTLCLVSCMESTSRLESISMPDLFKDRLLSQYLGSVLPDHHALRDWLPIYWNAFEPAAYLSYMACIGISRHQVSEQACCSAAPDEVLVGMFSWQ